MSQSKTTCLCCKRPPGGVHLDECPRSRTTRAVFDAHMVRPPRLLWKKGLLGFRNLKVAGPPRTTLNPGVPRTTGRNPRAGGIPRGKREEATKFLRDLGLEVTP